MVEVKFVVLLFFGELVEFILSDVGVCVCFEICCGNELLVWGLIEGVGV